VIGIGLGCLTLFLILLSPEAIKFLATEEYGEAVYAVFPIALSALPQLFSTITTAILIHRGKGRGVILTRLCSLLFGGISALLFIPLLGFFGAGLSYFISEICSFVASVILLGEYRKKLNFTLSRAFPIIFLPLILGGASLFLSPFLPLRILLLLIPSVALLNTLFYGRRFLFERSG
jgi:O-antigen/teichoic acid export membrane protein